MRSWLTYIAAFLCALGAVYLALSVTAGGVSRDSSSRGDVLGVVVLPALIGTLVFCMIFSAVGDVPFGLNQWLSTTFFVGAVVAACSLLVVSDTFSAPASMGAGLLVLFLGGRYLLRRQGHE